VRKQAILVLAMVVLLAASASAGTYSGGDGSAEYPYRIATPNDLNDIGNHEDDWDAHFVMVNDINLADYTGTQFNVICGSPDGGWYTMFEGVFDGDGHVIRNLNLEVDISMAGLFGYIGDSGVVKNVCLDGVDIKAIHYVGGIAGRNEGVIQNCHVSGTIEGEQACGGITGASLCPLPNNVSNCSFGGKVIGTDSTGGVVGSTDGTEVVKCYAIVEIIGEVQCGGIVGHNMGGNLQMCFSKGSITCSSSAGGFVGVTYDHCGYGGDILDCYADVTVNCSNYAGGFSGSAPGPYGQISNCYCSGKVVYDADNHTNVGGFIGEHMTPEDVFYSYFLESAGPDNGFGEPLSEKQMKQQESFAGWDFVEVWNIGENQTYPYLRVYPAGDMDHDDKVNLYDLAIMAEHWLEGTEH